MNGAALYSVTSGFLPIIIDAINWGSCWQRPLETGTAFEWTTFAAIAFEAKKAGWAISFPILDYIDGGALFRLRNEVPTHHPARPGHGSRKEDELALPSRFLQSLVPKLILEKDGVAYSVFREGCPYHKIMLSQEYSDRPDILFVKGRIRPGFPRLIDKDRRVEFLFDLTNQSIAGSLDIVNSPSIPLYDRQPEQPFAVPVTGIVECSVNKSCRVAEAQLLRYEVLFRSVLSTPTLYLITGNYLEPMPWPTSVIFIEETDIDCLQNQFSAAAVQILRSFAIL